MRVLVTGGTGFLGSNLVHHLVARGDEVRVLKRRRTPPTLIAGLPVELAEGDVTDFESVLAATRGVEGVYHVAALISYWRPKRERMFRVNVEGTRHVLEAARRNGIRRVVHTSSIAAIGFRDDNSPCDEDTPWNWGPLDIGYATSKHLAEQEVQKAVAGGLEAVIVNPGVIFGPRDTSWNAGRMFKLVEESSVIRGPEGSSTTCDVDDVCIGHIAAMERGQPGRRYILGGEHVRYSELFRMISEVMGKPVRIQAVPYWVAQVVAGAHYARSLVTRREPPITPELLRAARHTRYYTSERAIRELGYPRTPLRVSLEKTYRWYVENGYLPARS
ncbi:MAG: SDR family oxidoreductase [Acidobacteria bacterium]|nr:SDR family oxidoreductase [Acidobacteriota bacterium]